MPKSKTTKKKTPGKKPALKKKKPLKKKPVFKKKKTLKKKPALKKKKPLKKKPALKKKKPLKKKPSLKKKATQAKKPSPFKSLSERYLDIVALKIEGLSNAEISAKLGITMETVKSYRKLIYNRLKIHSTEELIELNKEYKAIRGKRKVRKNKPVEDTVPIKKRPNKKKPIKKKPGKMKPIKKRPVKRKPIKKKRRK